MRLRFAKGTDGHGVDNVCHSASIVTLFWVLGREIRLLEFRLLEYRSRVWLISLCALNLGSRPEVGRDATVSLSRLRLVLGSSKSKLSSFANALSSMTKALPNPQEIFLGVLF
jgi:hypothetical protein